jgi:hypothetical protein
MYKNKHKLKELKENNRELYNRIKQSYRKKNVEREEIYKKNQNIIVYVGFDSTNYGQELAYEVCKRSIKKYNNFVNVIPLKKKELENKKIFNRKDNTGSTEFTYTRFLVPHLQKYKGWALFCDSDFLWFYDIEKLFKEHNDEKYAVYCVKHKYENCNDSFKMDGRKQEWYPRKNWSSLMLFNCSHPSIKNLNLENINNQIPKWLHRMEWCKDEEIGELDKSFNYLVNYYDDDNFKALHFTDGGPWHEKYRNVDYGNLWINYLTDNEKSELFKDEIANKEMENNCVEKSKNVSINDSKILCVTTFNQKLYEEYAKRFIDTYNMDFDLVIYSEDDLSFLNNDKISTVNFNNDVPDIIKFIETNKEKNLKTSKKGFRWDAVRFCYKIYAVTHCALNNLEKYDYLIWLDADIIFKEELDKKTLLELFIRNNNMISYLGRKNYHSDCGFLIFDLNHKYTNEYMSKVKHLYDSNEIYNLKEYHDSYIWDYVRIIFENKYGIKNFNLGYEYSNNKSYNHILLKTPLFNYIDHLKGEIRKKIGTSKLSEFQKYLNQKREGLI